MHNIHASLMHPSVEVCRSANKRVVCANGHMYTFTDATETLQNGYTTLLKSESCDVQCRFLLRVHVGSTYS